MESGILVFASFGNGRRRDGGDIEFASGCARQRLKMNDTYKRARYAEERVHNGKLLQEMSPFTHVQNGEVNPKLRLKSEQATVRCKEVENSCASRDRVTLKVKANAAVITLKALANVSPWLRFGNRGAMSE
jgi:hypothetical protein